MGVGEAIIIASGVGLGLTAGIYLVGLLAHTFVRPIYVVCPRTGRRIWFPQLLVEESGGVTCTWTQCPQCWHGGVDLHLIKTETTSAANADRF